MAIIGAIPTHIHKQGVHAQEVTNLFQSSRDIVFHSLRVHPEGLASHRPCHTGGSDWDWTSNHAHILGMHYEILRVLAIMTYSVGKFPCVEAPLLLVRLKAHGHVCDLIHLGIPWVWIFVTHQLSSSNLQISKSPKLQRFKLWGSTVQPSPIASKFQVSMALSTSFSCSERQRQILGDLPGPKIRIVSLGAARVCLKMW
jgi:hypothetical protein